MFEFLCYYCNNIINCGTAEINSGVYVRNLLWSYALGSISIDIYYVN